MYHEKINKSIANQIDRYSAKIKNGNYTLSIKEDNRDCYFALQNSSGEKKFIKKIDLYADANSGNFNFDLAPFTEESMPFYCGDKEGNQLLVYYLNGEQVNKDDIMQFILRTEDIYIEPQYDGDEGGTLLKLSIKKDGKIYGLYSNAQEKAIAQIVISTSNTTVNLADENTTINVTKP